METSSESLGVVFGATGIYDLDGFIGRQLLGFIGIPRKYGRKFCGGGNIALEWASSTQSCLW
tara:strand:- start:236 stop:421 length:186 start_codon:yes stop_codon:yes gene_type:complete